MRIILPTELILAYKEIERLMSASLIEDKDFIDLLLLVIYRKDLFEEICKPKNNTNTVEELKEKKTLLFFLSNNLIFLVSGF